MAGPCAQSARQATCLGIVCRGNFASLPPSLPRVANAQKWGLAPAKLPKPRHFEAWPVPVPIFSHVAEELIRAEDDGFDLFQGHAVGQVVDEAGFAAGVGGSAEQRGVEVVHDAGEIFPAGFERGDELGRLAPLESLSPFPKCLSL